MTQLEKRRMMAVYCQHQVMSLLGMSELAYCWFKYQAGLDYLHHYLNGDEFAIDMISRSRDFWNWWKVNWTIREEEYLPVAVKLRSESSRLSYYKQMHNPLVLALEISPYGKQLGETYATMIAEVGKIGG